MKRMSLLTIVILAAGAPRDAAGLTFLDLLPGDEALLSDARAAALGRTRTAGHTGAFTAASNPAQLPRSDEMLVMLGGGFQKMKEVRSTPAYDSFDAFLVNSSYALNDKYQYEGGIGVSGPLGSGGVLGMFGAGLSYAPVWDFNYDYLEEVRDNNPFTQPRDKLIALNEVRSDGAIEAVTGGVGVAPLEWLAAGVSVQYLWGDSHLFVQTRLVQEDLRGFLDLETSSMSGVRGVVGLSVRPNHRFDFAATWKTQTTLEGKFRAGDAEDPNVFNGSFDVKYPNELGFGVVFRPRARVRTTIRAEANWGEWSKYENDLANDPRLAAMWDFLVLDGDLEDVWDFRAGIEHVFYNDFPVRFGFVHKSSPQDKQVVTTSFTFGGGLLFGPLRADAGVEVANRKYRHDDLFDDAFFGGTSRVTQDLVEENATFGYVTLSTTFDPWGG
jgi:hypothetical protein